MEIKDYHKRWLLKKVDGVWHKVVSSPSGYVTTILHLHETTAQNFADLRDANDQAGLSMPDLLDLIHDILPEDFVADVRSARKVKGEDGVPIGFFEANGSPNSRGCKGVIGHDLDWSEIYATNVIALAQMGREGASIAGMTHKLHDAPQPRPPHLLSSSVLLAS